MTKPVKLSLEFSITLIVLYLAFAFALCGCSESWIVPIVPPTPPPTPVPPEPPPPPPPPVPTLVATAENAAKVKVGMTRAEVDATLGVHAAFNSAQDDGTMITDYPAVDETDKPVYLTVHFNAQGVVTGRARIPRAVPMPPVASLPEGEIEDVEECVGGNCRLPGR